MLKNKLLIEVNDLVKLGINDNFFEVVGQETLKKVINIDKKSFSISVALVSETEISSINTRYRENENPTDVLSFSEDVNILNLCDNDEERDIFLGEIILCPDYIKKSSRQQGVTFEFELAYIFAHGILHLLGFNHGKEMFLIQQKVAEKCA